MKNFKTNFITGLLLFFFSIVSSQNTIIIGNEQVNNGTAFDLPIALNNTDAITAIQFDINFNSSAFELVTGSYLTSRASGHTLGVSNPLPGVIRVLLYSGSNASISGNTGDLIILKLKSKTLPGDFVLNYANVVVSSPSGTAVTTSVQPGSAKILGPQMKIVTTSVDFGRVPIGSAPTRTITIQNLGNQDLVLTSASSVVPFSIQESFPVTILANTSKNLTVQINSSAKYNSTANLSFQNNDPDALRKLQNVTLKAIVYAVNEIKIGSGSGEINTEVEIPVVIDNMEPFTGLQFDITLPTGIDYVTNSIIQTSRFDGHAISASKINATTLRILAYSITNKNFIGTSGEVFSFKLKPKVASGNYPLVISNAILSNLTLGDVLSDDYNGSIQINSPNLSLNPSSINYGNVPITETRETTIRLSNTGSALLTINEVVYNSSELNLAIQLPLDIAVGTYKDVDLTFSPGSSGSFVQTISFRHNGPEGQNLLQVNATKFSPNFVMVESTEGHRNETNTFQILLKNNNPVRAVQFDVELPAGFVLDVNNVAITVRSAGFNVAASGLGNNIYRVILYTISNSLIPTGNESIIELPTLIDKNKALGAYQFNFSNVVISGSTNENISSIILENGSITVVDKIFINPKAVLQGPFLNPTTVGLMDDDLRVGNLPTTSPYNDALVVNSSVFNAGGSSGAGEPKDDIVDWVWVELRDAISNTTIVNGKSAFMQRDGDIVDIDGVSTFSLNVPTNNYYVVINHRNHLGIMSATPLNLSSTPTIIDFTSSTATIYGGSNAVKDINGTLTMIGGDYDENGQIQNTDLANIVQLLGGAGYSKADLDMNGQIQNTDINIIINPNVGKGQQF